MSIGTPLISLLKLPLLLSSETCPFASSLFVCADNSTTLDKNLACDGIVDCPSGDDEVNCSKPSLNAKIKVCYSLNYGGVLKENMFFFLNCIVSFGFDDN